MDKSVEIKILGLEEITESSKIWRMLVAEFVGTLLLVMVGCGTIMYVDQAVKVVQVALTFGFTVACLAQSLGHVSGCHINPAVTLSFLIVGKCFILKAIFYIIVQCAGAAAGFYLLTLMTPSDVATGAAGATSLNGSLTETQGVLVEAFATFILCLAVHAVCDERRPDVKGHAPLAIGITIAVCHLFAVKYTGSSVNPARSFGPALVYGFWTNHWVYWAGPIIGGLLAGIFYRIFFQISVVTENTVTATTTTTTAINNNNNNKIELTSKFNKTNVYCISESTQIEY